MIRFKHSGSFKHTERFLKNAKAQTKLDILEKYGEAGVNALAVATPNQTGTTAGAWRYEIARSRNGYSIYWCNDHVHNGVNIALILQYGHGTGTGGYVKGIDYINPAIRPIFDTIANDAWKEVTSR